MSDINKLIEKTSRELAEKHVAIIEENIKAVCERFGLNANQLNLVCYPDNEFQIVIEAIRFKIDTKFMFGDETFKVPPVNAGYTG